MLASCVTAPSSPPTAPAPTAPAATATATPPTGVVRITVVGNSIQVDERLTYLDGEGHALGDPTAVLREQPAHVRRAFPPGTITVVMGDAECAGTFDIMEDQETDVLAWLNWWEEPRCILQSLRTHPAGETHSAATGQLIVEATPGADVRITPLDVIGGLPIKGPPDVRGYLTFIELPQGWYELSLMNGLDVAFRTPVEIGADGIGQLDVVIPPPDVPLECVEIAQRPCEAAMLEAWAWGLFAGDQQPGTLSGVSVGPASSKTCGSEPGSINELDVTFDFADGTSIAVSLTRRAGGHLHPCPAY